MRDDLKLKEGWYKRMDDHKNILHIFPIEGRKHNFDKCWCFPFLNEDTMIIHHNKSKANKFAESER